MPPARAVLYAATLAVLVFAVRAFLVRAPPLAVSAVALGAYVALVLMGVLRIELRMFADAVVKGPTDARGVALTFDDGPDPASTPAVLEALERAGAHATFFLIGQKAERHPELVGEIVRRGHAVGVHSYAHDRLFALRSDVYVRRDLERCLRVLERLTGERPLLFRPPIGHTNPTIARVADALDLITVGWTVSGRDGVGSATAERVASRVRRGLRDGAIVALHDAAERGGRVPAGVGALPAILDAAKDAGLEVVPLAEWAAQDAGKMTTKRAPPA
jgi:peptidoglycan/xylan/chitin deacetylase (PgdA/CDA1 family)